MSRRMTAAILVLLLGATVLLHAAEEKEEEEKPWTPEVSVVRAERYKIVEAQAPGKLVDTAETANGILLLSGLQDQPDAPLSLFLLGAAGEDPLETIADGLPNDAAGLFVLDLDGDGTGEPVLGMPGGLFALDDGGRLNLVVETEGFTPRTVRVWGGERKRLAIAGVGFLRIFHLDRERGRFVMEEEHRLPVSVERDRRGLRLRTVRPVALPGEGAPLFAVGPEAHGRQRLRTLLIDPVNGLQEAWSRFGEAEEVRQRWYLELDGRPALAVTSLLSDRKGVFEKQKLRLFLLAGDRTRAGAEPVLAVKTPGRHWFDSDVRVTEVNGDGRDDLVFVVPVGLGGGQLLVDAWIGRGDGRFEPKPRRSLLEIESEGWHYGGDVDGDGVADLVVFRDNRVAVYPGLANPASGEVVADRPLWETEPAGSGEAVELTIGITSEEMSAAAGFDAGEIRVLDLHGDSRDEILLLSDGDIDERGAVRIVLPD